MTENFLVKMMEDLDSADAEPEWGGRKDWEDVDRETLRRRFRGRRERGDAGRRL